MHENAGEYIDLKFTNGIVSRLAVIKFVLVLSERYLYVFMYAYANELTAKIIFLTSTSRRTSGGHFQVEQSQSGIRRLHRRSAHTGLGLREPGPEIVVRQERGFVQKVMVFL